LVDLQDLLILFEKRRAGNYYPTVLLAALWMITGYPVGDHWLAALNPVSFQTQGANEVRRYLFIYLLIN